ncbi:probable E3 ubiquitin-protein ligase ari7 [Phtheirospermum japonicum]|uniref:RBR-type E3 ubiquitin transferase n=1 Tax=Phtheirospermum japonicum TaxID=374723 RepID=A0A830D433_9LAMI|nr:probable E3 ubiquitin-protein ligase ari7 [Phtheirospermum japonicum]
MDSEEDDRFYYDGEDYESDDEVQDTGKAVTEYSGGHCKILRKEEIKKLQERDISDVSSVLSVSRSVACTLLCQNRWNIRSVYDRWFSDDHEIKLVEQQESSSSPPNKKGCRLCHRTAETENILSADCGHLYCVLCWKTHIHASLKEGPGCLALTCPEPGCKSLPGLDMVDSAASPDDRDEYYHYLYRSYVDSSTNRKWCPNPSCDLAIEFDKSGESDDVTCDCGYTLCWSCGKEGHSPLDCEMVAKWIQKNKSEADSTAWILANTKPCPKCGRAIQNVGFDHVTCGEPCGYEFCWRCRGPWELHGPGGPCYRALSNNKATDKEDKGGDSQRNRELAKEHLERYTHYYERWDSNDKSMKRALADLSTARNEHIDRLTETQIQSHSQLMFVIEAWEQIVECRRVLKWSYAYGYYNMSKSESGKLELFEHLQGEAESALERLHHCAEKEMDKYLSADYPCKDFNEFRKKVAGLTSVTKNYFENLVRALENNLSEVQIVVKPIKIPWRI